MCLSLNFVKLFRTPFYRTPLGDCFLSVEKLIRSEVATCQPESLRKKNAFTYTPLYILSSSSRNASRLRLQNFFKRGFETVQALLETTRNSVTCILLLQLHFI